MSKNSTSETMQAYLNMLLADKVVPEQSSGLDKPRVDNACKTKRKEEQDSNSSSVTASEKIQQQEHQLLTDPSQKKKAVSAAALKRYAIERSHALSESVPSENSPSSSLPENVSTKPLVSKDRFKSPQEKQLQQHRSDKGVGRPVVPDLEETEALRVEQKLRLQKLLSQQSLKVETTANVPPPEVKLKQEINQEFKNAVSEELNVESKQKPSLEESVETSSELTPHNEQQLGGTFHSESAQKREWHDNGRPYWGQERFDALLFDVGGLTLAVPLVALGQIVRFEKDELTPIFGQSDWFMGLLESSVGRLRVINTALFVMPEKYDQTFLDSAEYAISLDGVQWALAVDKVNQPISLDPAEIRWRSERSKRPWLAGTVKSQMCALIDIPQMADLLNQSDKTISTQKI